MATVSVIANFYKSEKYIPQLIESIIVQTYTDWELICVNDCSPQNDLYILQQFAAREHRIKIVDNKTNLGISKAKFEGIRHATGKYLMFIDGDDWLEPEAIERCVDPAERYNLDMVMMGYQKVLKMLGHNLYKKTEANRFDLNRVITNPELFDKYYINFFGVNLFIHSYWGKLIRRAAFERAALQPSNTDFHEDVRFNMLLFPHLNSIQFIDYIGYNWRWGGITSGRLATTEKRTLKLLAFVLEFYHERLQLLKQYNYEKGFRYLTIELVNYLIVNVSNIASDKTASDRLISLIKEYVDVIRTNKVYLDGCVGTKFDVVLRGNSSLVYSFCRDQYKKNYLKNNFKKIVHLFSD